MTTPTEAPSSSFSAAASETTLGPVRPSRCSRRTTTWSSKQRVRIFQRASTG
jgi:hypothetical protein